MRHRHCHRLVRNADPDPNAPRGLVWNIRLKNACINLEILYRLTLKHIVNLKWIDLKFLEQFILNVLRDCKPLFLSEKYVHNKKLEQLKTENYIHRRDAL